MEFREKVPVPTFQVFDVIFADMEERTAGVREPEVERIASSVFGQQDGTHIRPTIAGGTDDAGRVVVRPVVDDDQLEADRNRLDVRTNGRSEKVAAIPVQQDGAERWVSASAQGPCLLLIRQLTAHGFCVLGNEPADVMYKVDAPYNPRTERGILWCDADLAVKWPVADPIVSDRDAALPWLSELGQTVGPVGG